MHPAPRFALCRTGEDENELPAAKKAGYIWQNGISFGYSHGAKQVPSEWQAGDSPAKITDIEFGDTAELPLQ